MCIASIQPGSAAEVEGLTEGDHILKVLEMGSTVSSVGRVPDS